MSAWQIFATFGSGLVAGLVLGWIGGQSVGFYLGRRYELKRLSKVLAGKTALEVVSELMKTGKLVSTKKKKATVKQAWPPRDETRH